LKIHKLIHVYLKFESDFTVSKKNQKLGYAQKVTNWRRKQHMIGEKFHPKFMFRIR